MPNKNNLIKRFKVGQEVYIVKNSEHGIKAKKYKVINIFNSLQAVLIEGTDKKQIKIYKDGLGDLLTEEEAKVKYNEIKNNQPFMVKPNIENGTFCFNCKAAITKTKYNYCPVCHGSICSVCKSCFCNKKY